MPKFFVQFSQAVVDQPDHPKRNRAIDDGLLVHATTVEGAVFHAARVTRGEGVPIACYNDLGQRVWGDQGPETLAWRAVAAPFVEKAEDQVQVFHA